MGGHAMEILEKVLVLIPKIETHLQYFSFISSVALISFSIFLRSHKFHSLWSDTIKSKLDSSSIFRLFRTTILLAGIIILTAVILAFYSPIALQNIESQRKQSLLDFLARDRPTTISELESSDFRDKFQEAWILFKHSRNYEAAREAFARLEQLSIDEITRETLAGLITATYYVQKRHEDGLNYICERYRRLAKTDSRYRYEVHAHVRRLAIDFGFEHAERVVHEYADRCNRRDFSPVWIAIPRAKIEYLVKHTTNIEESFKLSDKEKLYLENLIHKDEAGFLDHAHYFLFNNKDLIKKFPGSYILDMAILAQAQISQEGDASAYYYNLFLEKFPRSPRAGEAVDGLFRNLVAARNFDAAMAVLERVPDYEIWGFEYQWQEYLDDGESHYARGEFQRALAIYEKQLARMQAVGVPVPSRIIGKIAELNTVIKMSTDKSIGGLWNLAIYFREIAGQYYARRGRHENAINLFQDIQNQSPSSFEAQKSLFLQASSLRKLGKYKESFDTLARFTTIYNDSYLVDDAYAEMGWYKLYIEDNFVEARIYFEKCINDYPRANAADNCLYHLARGAMSKGYYQVALDGYAKLAQYFAKTRLGVEADTESNRRVARQAAVGRQRQPRGATFEERWRGVLISDVAENSWAFRVGLRKGDLIYEVNGGRVDSIMDLHYHLGKSVIKVEIKFVRDSERYILGYASNNQN
jgi:tetratricopeptide (TPR) repeat protein